VFGREALVCIGLALASPAVAVPPTNIVPSPGLEAWFKGLKQPVTKSPCCTISDCRFVDYMFRDGRYEVEIEGWRYVVPAETILDGIASPVGGAVICYTYRAFGLPIPAGVVRDRAQDTIEILCFVPPWPTS
jgi:hypothetical protein